jgi:hypothetical protein
MEEDSDGRFEPTEVFRASVASSVSAISLDRWH